MSFLPILLSAVAISQTVPIENFESGIQAWKARNPPLSKEHPEYSIVEEGANHFLRGAPLPTQEGNILYKTITIDTKKTPILKWRWRPLVFPINGDEGAGRNDSALGVYVYFQSGPLRRLIKYVWSTSHKKGEWLTSPGSSWFWKTRIHILQSGPPIGQWVEETIDLRKDYKEAYDDDVPAKAFGIGVLTDGDQTKSESKGDYDDFVALPAEPTSTVK